MEKPNGYDELDTKYNDYLHTEQWKRIARKRLEVDGYVCQACGSRGSSLNKLEIHHFGYTNGVIFNEENYLYTHLVTLCHACHKLIGNTMKRVTNEDGRRGWDNNPTIPKINVFTLSGEEMETREENRK